MILNTFRCCEYATNTIINLDFHKLGGFDELCTYQLKQKNGP